MTPEQWQRAQDLFARALDLDASARSAFLAAECASDPELRREVESLLAAHEKPGGFQSFVMVDGAPIADEPGPGTVVDEKYRLGELLGAGGMGAVYRATDLRLERTVAIKLIRPALLGDPSIAERFRREAVSVARLRHPNIVMVHDYGVTGGIGAYLVMEYLEGRSLRAVLEERSPLEVGEALALMAQTCDAVAAAHEAGIVHRDLKPDNVFLHRECDDRGDARGPRLKVLDFGIAKLTEEAGALTRSGVVLGTPAYMSPEQCRGEEADARSDVYALGCLLYEMLAGRPPFVATTPAALLHKHVHELPERPGAWRPGIDPSLERALMRALAKAPAARHQTVEAFARALGLRSGEVGLPARGTRHTNLRHAATRFVGRGSELVEVRDWLARTRLITLTGPGGIGKTRLALEAAARAVDEYRDGVWLVELAALADPALVEQEVASALDVREQRERPMVESLAEALREKQLLLLLDNCEHLVDACARLTERLLAAAPELRVLATSREALGIAGEAVWPVPPLAVPAHADGAFECEAATLFADRASLARPGFEIPASHAALVAQLCRRLEGIPLAIELAASRVKALSVEEILSRLDDRFRLLDGGSGTVPAHQRALQATLDWSYDLLTEEERALLRRLSVFAGGWTLEAAEAASGTDVLQHLERLVDKSLVVAHHGGRAVRYAMLETIREYALERLKAIGEADDAQRRQAEYFLALAEAARPELAGAREAVWLDRLETEHDNLRAALAWTLENDPDACLRLTVVLRVLWHLHGHFGEGLRWLDVALKRSTAAPPRTRMRALSGAGDLALLLGQLEVSRAYFQENLRIAVETGDAGRVASSYYRFGLMAVKEGDLPVARAHLEKCLAIAREVGNDIEVANSLNGLGEVARLEGDLTLARDFYERALALARRLGKREAVSVGLANLGAIALTEGNLKAARDCYLETLAIARELGSTDDVATSLDGLAAEAVERGAWARAGRLAGAAGALREPSGHAPDPADAAFRERYLTALRELLGEAAFEAALAEGRAMTLERAVALAIG
jgi:predicted ATPase